MSLRIPMHRGALIAIQAVILATMLTIFIAVDSFSHANPVIMMMYLMVPAMVIVWSVIEIDRKARVLGYWGLAALMVPLAGLGIFGGYGLLYLIGIIFLLWAAWTENEGNARHRE